MHKYLKLVLVVTMAINLSACATSRSLYHKQHLIEDRDTAYLQGKAVPPLKFPSTIKPTLKSDEEIAVGEFAYPTFNNLPAAPISLVPPGSLAAEKKS